MDVDAPTPALFSLAVLERYEADLAGVDAAIAGIDARTFGRCDACGEPISVDSLSANPLIGRCEVHATTR